LDHSEFFENLEGDIEGPRPIFKKILIGFLGIFLIIIILSYFLFSPGARIVIAGLFDSSVLEDDLSLSLNFGGNLYFINNSYETLLEIYNENELLEFKACLFGEKLDENYFISSVVQPVIYSQSYTHVSAEKCSNSSLVSLHSHPYKRCYPSYQDFVSFSYVKMENNDSLMAIMCDKTRFNVFSTPIL
jgi:proteasome lid subunit RPN8/RPN11